MNVFEKFLYILQTDMETPIPYGWFHWLWIGLIFISIFLFFLLKNNKKEGKLKIVLGTYGIIAFVLELLKQVVWSFNFDAATNVVSWDYQWYAAPFQLCTTPLYVSLICLFLKDSKIRNSLLSYLSFCTFCASIMVMLLPDSCFTSDILVNIHTMWLHAGSLVVSFFLLITGYVKIKFPNFIQGFMVFLVFVGIAEALNIGIYNSGILGDETFDMFYISPYFSNSLPVFSSIKEVVPFGVYLFCYLLAMFLGGLIIFLVSKGISRAYQKHDELHNLLIKYIETFDMNFPLKKVKNNKEAVELLKETLKENRPYR